MDAFSAATVEVTKWASAIDLNSVLVAGFLGFGGLYLAATHIDPPKRNHRPDNAANKCGVFCSLKRVMGLSK